MRYFSLAVCFWVLSVLGNAAQAQGKPEFEGQKFINGTKLYVKIIGEGEPLLIINGGPGLGHTYLYDHLLPLAKTHKLVFYDSRSTGASPKGQRTTLTHQRMVEDVEALRAMMGVDKIDILAHSWGAKIAVNYALQYPGNVNKLVLSNPVAFNHQYDSVMGRTMQLKKMPADEDSIMKAQAWDQANRTDRVSTYDLLFRMAFKTSFYNVANMAQLKLNLPDSFVKMQNALIGGMMIDYNQFDRDMYDTLHNIKAPVMILHGMADNLPLKADEKLQKAIQGSKLVIFNQSGHFPFIEEKERFIKEVNDFLKK